MSDGARTVDRTAPELVLTLRRRNEAVIAERTRFWMGPACAVHAEVPGEDGSGRIARGPCMLPPGHEGDHTPYPPTENLPDGIELAPWEATMLLDAYEKATDALNLILAGPADPDVDGPGWCAGVASSALASIADPYAPEIGR